MHRRLTKSVVFERLIYNIYFSVGAGLRMHGPPRGPPAPPRGPTTDRSQAEGTATNMDTAAQAAEGMPIIAASAGSTTAQGSMTDRLRGSIMAPHPGGQQTKQQQQHMGMRPPPPMSFSPRLMYQHGGAGYPPAGYKQQLPGGPGYPAHLIHGQQQQQHMMNALHHQQRLAMAAGAPVPPHGLPPSIITNHPHHAHQHGHPASQSGLLLQQASLSPNHLMRSEHRASPVNRVASPAGRAGGRSASPATSGASGNTSRPPTSKVEFLPKAVNVKTPPLNKAPTSSAAQATSQPQPTVVTSIGATSQQGSYATSHPVGAPLQFVGNPMAANPFLQRELYRYGYEVENYEVEYYYA